MLPAFLSHQYDFLDGPIAHLQCLFAVDQGSTDLTPAEIAKHLSRVQSAVDGPVIYAARHLSADRRSRLIANGVPFVIPGNQLYIPQLALDLREHYRTRPKRSAEQLSPVAQAILFYHLLQLDERQNTPSRLAKALYYSAMSVGRAFEELLMHKLAMISKVGRTKKLQFADDGQSLLEKARPLLRSPARNQLDIQTGSMMPDTMRAGESALASLTDLSPPTLPVEAIHINQWRTLIKVLDVKIVRDRDEANTVLELWHYNPKILAQGSTVDPLSLYAQFWDHSNERVAKAAEDLLDRVQW